MKEEVIKVRIVNKSKDSVTIKANSKTKKLSWEEFNGIFTVDSEDKFTATMKPDVQEETEKIRNAINDAAMNAFLISLNKSNPAGDAFHQLTLVSNLGSDFEKVKELTGWTNEECLSKIREQMNRIKKTMNPYRIHKETREEYKARKKRENQFRPENPTLNKISGKNLEVLAKLKQSMADETKETENEK